jgi:hypothetical protein
MSLNKVLYVGQAVADQLIDSIDENVDRYSRKDSRIWQSRETGKLLPISPTILAL